MSGHSKWANIKRQKQANDKIKGSHFAKLSRLITLAVVEAGGMIDPDHNVKLRLAIEKARNANMPKESINRAIEKGTGPNKNDIKEIVYEAFAPPNGTINLIILASSDNLNRTTSEIRNLLEKYGAKLGSQGSVLYLFKKCGLVIFDKKQVKEDDIIELGGTLQAIDIDTDETHYYMYIPFELLGKLKDIDKTIPYLTAELDYKPQALILLQNSTDIKKLMDLVEALEDHDDIHKVFGNFDIPEQHLR